MFDKWVDSHCHLTIWDESMDTSKMKDPDIEDWASQTSDIDHTAVNMSAILESIEGLEFVVNVGVDPEQNKNILFLCEQKNTIYGTLGIHPNHASEYHDSYGNFLKQSLQNNPKIRAMGEIGLDYFYDIDRSLQKHVFQSQLQIAQEVQKPVVIHARSSIMDCLEILKDFKIVDNLVVFHCFTGNLQEARAIIDQGYWISYTGVITFPKSDEIRQAVAITPRDRVMVETDSPWLAPVPYRGKKNQPQWVSHVGEKLAEVWGLSVSETQNITTSNAYRFFQLRP